MRYLPIWLAAGVLLLAACGDATTTGSDAPEPLPSTPAVAAGEVETRMTATVLDDGDGAELCLGGVAESYPPQCSGLKLPGWDWAAHEGHFEEANGVRWGDFHVVGTFDGTQLTPTRVTPAAQWQGPALPEEPDLTTPCPEPEGGWRVVDPALTTLETRDRVFEAAARLEGYAGAWLDGSRNPRPDDDPAQVIVNVKVTGDPAAAEAELRKVWGGMLCVTTAERTEAELTAIQEELSRVDGVLGAHGDAVHGRVELWVTYDDGTLQAQLDERYGDGVVAVTSALRPLR